MRITFLSNLLFFPLLEFQRKFSTIFPTWEDLWWVYASTKSNPETKCGKRTLVFRNSSNLGLDFFSFAAAILRLSSIKCGFSSSFRKINILVAGAKMVSMWIQMTWSHNLLSWFVPKKMRLPKLLQRIWNLPLVGVAWWCNFLLIVKETRLGEIYVIQLSRGRVGVEFQDGKFWSSPEIRRG